jgi:hypothetical protein
MSQFTRDTAPVWHTPGGQFLVGLLGTSLGFFVVWVHPSFLTLLVLGPAAVLGAGAIAAQFRQDRTALLSVLSGSLLAGGVVCVLILWNTVTGSLSSNFHPWVVAGELVGLVGVLITVALGFALGSSLARRRP